MKLNLRLTDFFSFHGFVICSSECESARQKALCSFPEANLSLSTGERVSIENLLGPHTIVQWAVYRDILRVISRVCDVSQPAFLRNF